MRKEANIQRRQRERKKNGGKSRDRIIKRWENGGKKTKK